MRPCAAPGCPALVQRGRCAEHAKAQDRARGTAHARGYDYRWAQYSVQFRNQHPICGERHDGTLSPEHSRCLQEGRYKSVLGKNGCVDHIVPVSRGGSMWDARNHQSLCVRCNTAKGDQ